MKRHLLITVAILTGLLSIGSLGLWVGSQWYSGVIEHVGERRAHVVKVHRSRLFCFWYNSIHAPTGWSARVYPTYVDPVLDAPRVSSAGFGYGRLVVQGWFAIVPLWFPSLIGGLACLASIRRLRRRQHAPGLCAACGYDLRAHHPGQRCPECGTPIPAPQP